MPGPKARRDRNPAPSHLPADHFAPIEGAERKPWSTTGRLTEETLKTMLQVQEQTD